MADLPELRRLTREDVRRLAAIRSFAHDETSIPRECEVAGLFVIRTKESPDVLSADAAVRTNRSLAQVEQAFRCLGQTDLEIHRIRQRTENRVRAPAAPPRPGASGWSKRLLAG